MPRYRYRYGNCRDLDPGFFTGDQAIAPSWPIERNSGAGTGSAHNCSMDRKNTRFRANVPFEHLEIHGVGLDAENPRSRVAARKIKRGDADVCAAIDDRLGAIGQCRRRQEIGPVHQNLVQHEQIPAKRAQLQCLRIPWCNPDRGGKRRSRGRRIERIFHMKSDGVPNQGSAGAQVIRGRAAIVELLGIRRQSAGTHFSGSSLGADIYHEGRRLEPLCVPARPARRRPECQGIFVTTCRLSDFDAGARLH
jgi:hypothetical protein